MLRFTAVLLLKPWIFQGTRLRKSIQCRYWRRRFGNPLVVKIGKIIMYAYIGSYMYSLKSITVGSGNSAYASDNGVLYDKAQSQLFFTRPQSLTRNTHFLPRSAHRIQRAAPQKARAAAMSALLHIMCRAERKSLPQVLTETVFLRTQKRHCPEHQCRNWRSAAMRLRWKSLSGTTICRLMQRFPKR